MCVCACARACARVRVPVCARARVCVCVGDGGLSFSFLQRGRKCAPTIPPECDPHEMGALRCPHPSLLSSSFPSTLIFSQFDSAFRKDFSLSPSPGKEGPGSKVGASSWDSFPANPEHFKQAPSQEARFSWKLNSEQVSLLPWPSQERGARAAPEQKSTEQMNLGTR